MSARTLVLAVVNPGHFHAALSLREHDARLHREVYVYAEPGPDLDRFLAIVQSYNQRSERPTDWQLQVYRGADYLERLLTEKRADIAIVAGKNAGKLDLIERLLNAELHVLADKPWLIDARQLAQVERVSRARCLAMDIMTERHDVATRIQQALAAQTDFFGTWRGTAARPAIELKSVHHLHKQVNGKALVRPAWYFDLAVQGAGITDVTTHLVDLAHWIAMPEGDRSFTRDVQDLRARQWTTPVPLAAFSRITGLSEFPAALRVHVLDDVLHYRCNAALAYRLRGVPVAIEALWELDEPAGGADLHYCALRGTHAELIVEQSARTAFIPELIVKPSPGAGQWAKALQRALGILQARFPGIASEAWGDVHRIVIPAHLRNTHEQRFAAVLREFLDYVAGEAWPTRVAGELLSKYCLLAKASE